MFVLGIVERFINLFRGNNWLVIPAALLCIVVHEVSHGYAAYLLGDRTAKSMGRLTLNPLPHIDPIGLICMMLFGFGWAKPVPVNPYHFNKRKLGMAIVAFAGPLSNILFAVISLLLLRLNFYISANLNANYPVFEVLASFFTTLAILNVGLAVFNLIPVPPLDGSKVVFSLLPHRLYGNILRFEQYGIFILIVLINLPVFNNILSRMIENLFEFIVSLIFI